MTIRRFSHALRSSVFLGPIDTGFDESPHSSSHGQRQDENNKYLVSFLRELRSRTNAKDWRHYIEKLKSTLGTREHGGLLDESEMELAAGKVLISLGKHGQSTEGAILDQLKCGVHRIGKNSLIDVIQCAEDLLSDDRIHECVENFSEEMINSTGYFVFYGEDINFGSLPTRSFHYDHNSYRLYREGDLDQLCSEIHPHHADEGVSSRLYNEFVVKIRGLRSTDNAVDISENELVDRIERTILSHKDNSQLQSALMDLLGYEESVFPLVEWICSRPNEELRTLFLTRHEEGAKTFSLSDGLKKQHTEFELTEAIEAPSYMSAISTTDKNYLPFVFTSSMNFVLNEFGKGYRLPSGTTRNIQETFEEYVIPMSKVHDRLVNETLIIIEDVFDEIGKKVFENYKSLNRVQSIVFDAAYRTNENLLVCAPTGAGKTDIALLTILREINQNRLEDILDMSSFKIAYVAPMKALAAEITEKFSNRLSFLGIKVRELTGDMQLSKKEILDTQIIVTTPEKWDVITRKSVGDLELTGKVRVLIIDEIHLLHDERGSVLESLVARTLRQVEMTQTMVRIVGLSATLPNFLDVARFLRVNPQLGLFYFDNGFRPVPLGQTFIGIKAMSSMKQLTEMNAICFQKALECVKAGRQVMVFVHSRKETVKTAIALKEMVSQQSLQDLFSFRTMDTYRHFSQRFSKSKNRELGLLFEYGFLFHHAGMLRADRSLVEQCFLQDGAKVLVCTATLAWGVNLPAHTVIIKGTKIYDAQRGGFVDIGILDVLQIFGRAGRPQYENHGEGIIITTYDKLRYYLCLLLQQIPIESQFLARLEDHLNAEIALGTILNVGEAITWLSYTYWYVCIQRNPMQYGLTFRDLETDPYLQAHRKNLIINAALRLDKSRMIRFDSSSSTFFSTDLGRLASFYYISYETVALFDSLFSPLMTEAELIALISSAMEFENLKVREEEIPELEHLKDDYCIHAVGDLVTEVSGKVNILLQTYISNGKIGDFALISDVAYIAQNAIRISRFLFEVSMKNGWASLASKLLSLSKSLDKRVWSSESPLYQFPILHSEVVEKLNSKSLSLQDICDMSFDEIGSLVRNRRYGPLIKKCALEIPRLCIEATLRPVTNTILKIDIEILPNFSWNDKYHGAAEAWWIWVEDPMTEVIHSSEYFILRKKDSKTSHRLTWMIPIAEIPPSHVLIRAISDRWLGAEDVYALPFHHLILPSHFPSFTPLLNLRPLSISSLQDSSLLEYYRHEFEYFNPIQTQIFFQFYHTDFDILLGAPTGSGKTIAAELAIWRAFQKHPSKRVIYIAPLKALVRERMHDWKARFRRHLGKIVIELTGDINPSFYELKKSNLIITTPEKWDCVSRRFYLSNSLSRKISLIIFDEIHLLGQDRGPILEAIVSRTKFLNSQAEHHTRMIGLSTALANPKDLGDWIGVPEHGLFNFKPSVRPVPIEIHIQGFAGKHYCPRMASMNRSVFSAIKQYSSNESTLVFVSSRRQTRLTAQDLITCCVMNDRPKQFLKMSESECDAFVSSLKDFNTKLTLPFGIGLHHAGLHENDRKIVENLFSERKIQVLIATSTLAWGVNLPAHLVIIKGTEFYDGKRRDYVDMPITDILQMTGRAGRPQFDNFGVACIFVQDKKKDFYKRFIYDPFPVESNLESFLIEHINSEVVSGMIKSRQDALRYMAWTYYFRRLHANPSYYGLKSSSVDDISRHISDLIDNTIQALLNYGCVNESAGVLEPSPLGIVAASCYVSVKTVNHFNLRIEKDHEPSKLLQLLSEAHEFYEIPVRHNEEFFNTELANQLPLPCDGPMNSPHVKTFLLLQAHLCRCEMPISDYSTDLKSVLDQAMRLIQAMIDIVAERGYLTSTLNSIHLMQMLKQGRWLSQSSLLQLPYLDDDTIVSLNDQHNLRDLCDLLSWPQQKLSSILSRYLRELDVKEVSFGGIRMFLVDPGV